MDLVSHDTEGRVNFPFNEPSFDAMALEQRRANSLKLAIDATAGMFDHNDSAQGVAEILVKVARRFEAYIGGTDQVGSDGK